MLKRTLGLSLPVVLAVTFFLGLPNPDVAAKNRFISIGTGGPTGVYFVVGNAVCRMVHREAAEGRKKGRKHGKGTFIYSNGKVEQGIWKNDKFESINY